MEKETKQKIDRYDVALSISSGALTAAMDVLWVGDISLENAHKDGSKMVDEFVMKVAKSKGYSGTNISGAIKKLEDEYKMYGDDLTKEFGSGVQHHLRDFSHHPTPVGLMFSILMQFTGKGYGTETNGSFVTYNIPGWERRNLVDAIYSGTIEWFFHLVSDIAGSSGTRRDASKEGTGLPGPLLSLLKEMSAIPGIKGLAGKTDPKNSPNKEENYRFSVMCSKLFNGTLLGEHDENGKIRKDGKLIFDLRTELGIVTESVSNKQYLPVILNEVIVSAFYSVRRFMLQIQELGISTLEELERIDLSKCLPWKNDVIRHMRMIAKSTFSAIDLSVAGVRAAVKNKNNPKTFALEFMQEINYWGLGSLALSSNSEFQYAIQKLQTGFIEAAEKQKQAIIEKLPNGKKDWDSGKFGVETAVSITKIGTPFGFISAAIGVYDEINKALTDLKLATEERIRVEKECAERIEMIREYRQEMDEMVSSYLNQKTETFIQAYATMDRAVSENDIEAYILGSNMIQTELSGKKMFSSMDEFDEMMEDDEALIF